MFLNRLYFRKDTGVYIYRNYMNDYGSNSFLRLPTVEEDFSSFSFLAEYNVESVLVIELEEGEYTNEIERAKNNISIDVETLEMSFKYPDMEEGEVVVPPISNLNTQVKELQQENQILKAQNNAITERADFIEDIIAEMAMVVYS